MSDNTNKWNAPNPWLGLGAYSEGQQLYGRDKETAALSDIIINHTTSVVYGKSGIGKSSLLRAGVFPLLRSNGFVPIYLRLIHNTDVSYVHQIENAITNSVTVHDLLPDNICFVLHSPVYTTLQIMNIFLALAHSLTGCI